MRRFLTWQLPFALALISALVFGYGLYEFFRGDAGKPLGPVANAAVVTKPTAKNSSALTSIILGDSLARGTGDESGLGIAGRLGEELKRRHVAAKPTINVAVNGAKTRDLLELLQRPNVRRLIGESDFVIVSIGGNDLWGDNEIRGMRPANPDAVMQPVLDNVVRIGTIVRAANPRAHIFLIGLYNPFIREQFGPLLNPLVARWNAKLVEQFAMDPNFTVVQTSDIFAYRDRLSFDRFHPSGEGYTLIARRIADAL